MSKVKDEPPNEALINETIRIIKLKIERDIITFSNNDNQTQIIKIHG